MQKLQGRIDCFFNSLLGVGAVYFDLVARQHEALIRDHIPPIHFRLGNRSLAALTMRCAIGRIDANKPQLTTDKSHFALGVPTGVVVKRWTGWIGPQST